MTPGIIIAGLIIAALAALLLRVMVLREREQIAGLRLQESLAMAEERDLAARAKIAGLEAENNRLIAEAATRHVARGRA
jgi:hypothetical protein